MIYDWIEKLFGIHICHNFTRWGDYLITMQIRECVDCGKKFTRFT